MTTNTKHEGYTSKYIIIETTDGFRVEGRDRHPVHVRLAPSQTAWLVGFTETDISARINLYAYSSLIKEVSRIAMCQWQRPAGHPSNWGGIYQWARSRTELAINHRVYEQWQRLLAVVPETKRAVTRAVFAATFSTSGEGCEAWDELYEYPYLIKDILNYRAAAVACHYAVSQTQSVGRHLSAMVQEDPTFIMSRYQEQLLDFYTRSFDPDPSDLAYAPFDPEQSKCRQELVEFLAQDWKALFSRTGKASTSLCKTLMNLPGKMSGQYLRQSSLAEPLLSRPITDRVELMALLSFAAHHYEYHSENPSFPLCNVWEAKFYQKAQRSEILSALKLLSRHLRQTLTAKQADMVLFVNYIRDYCRHCTQEGLPYHPQHGNIVGLTEKAIAWHKELRQQNIQEELVKYEGRESTPTAQPSVALPDNKAILFLATVGDVVREGVEMQHCIAGSVEEAVAGYSYLFHVEYKGATASVQVDYKGNVVQSYGPCNATNDASLYGKRILAQWGKKLQQVLPPFDTSLHIVGLHQGEDRPGELNDQPF